MMPPNFFSLSLLLYLQLCPSWLYTFHSCSFRSNNLEEIFCHSMNLSRIPSEVPSSALSLEVTNNNIQKIQQSDFCGLNGLQSLDLEQNQISYIEDGKLDLSRNVLSHPSVIVNISVSCPFLQTLDLSQNHFTSFESKYFPFPLNISELNLSGQPLHCFSLHSDLFPPETYQLVFKSVGSLENLDIRGVNVLHKGLLDFACSIPSLQKLDLSSNAISDLNNSLLQLCTNLTYLDLSRNSMANVSESSLQMLTRLSKLDMGQNHLTAVPQTIRNMSSLTTLQLYSNRIKKLHCLDFSNLWHLTILKLNDNLLVELNSCVFQDLHSLKMLDLDNNFIVQFDDSFGTSLPNLLTLSVTNNNIAWIQNGKFNLPSLQTLHIKVSLDVCLLYSQDFLKGLDNLKEFTSFDLLWKPHIETFRNTPQLRSLNMYNNGDLILDSELFQPIRHLESLILIQNYLKSLDFLSQANLTELQTLHLRANDLTVINEAVFETLPSLKYLELSDNPFACNCSNAGFIHWALTNKQVFVDGAYQYRCASPLSHKGLLLFDFNVQSCWEFANFLCFIFSLALVLITLLSAFIYHFLRWQLVYSFYLLRAYMYHSKKRRQDYAHTYDAFVSYNVHDEDWVYKELVPELEERQGWRLCLHHRDFEPGKAIVENITDAIYSSRKTLCVISHQYLGSEWCSREIQMASFRLFDEQKDVLILLFLEEISPNQLNPFYRMRKWLRSRTYLSWSQARSHRGLFWERVRRALQCGAEISNNPLPVQV
uniref:TIR domain-containing protein n=1 Tax=Periophthalmus magnuspinnatus TaxID=409849 RepID=A0A3B3ZFC9_9GOBI